MNDSKMSTSLPLAFRGDTPVSIQVQSILYNNRASDVKRALQSLARSAELAMRAGVCKQVLVRYGDSSQMPCFRDDEVAELQREFGSTI
ncbi:hypothetical protein, partial [Enterococcus faecalis]|uniref:hypothetical protein n=1 Tax=Enterococcus faecalis TaxID=1351 RepID=UPI001C529551